MNPYDKIANVITGRRFMLHCATFRGRGLTGQLLGQWFSRFGPDQYRLARRFLLAARFFRATVINDALVRESNRVMEHLQNQGVPPDEVLVVQVDDLASSAAKAVTTFRKNAPSGKTCNYSLATDTQTLISLARGRRISAVIYVDDFIGTGDQLQGARIGVISALGLAVPEYVITAIILEEAKALLDRECSVQHYYVHNRSERPMLPECRAFSSHDQRVLFDVSSNVGEGLPLGYGTCASMVVLADDVPDNSPALLREALFLLA